MKRRKKNSINGGQFAPLHKIPKRMKFLVSLFLLSAVGHAQVFPVQGSLQIAPPYSPFLTDYTAPGTQKLALQPRSNDVALGDHPIRFRLTIEGAGIAIRTKPNYVPPSPYTLAGDGALSIFYGEDLLDYFNPDRLDFAGFSPREFRQSGKLPEGLYQFSFEVFDYYRQIALSHKITLAVWIVLNDPPLLNLPRHNTTVALLDPVNVAFAWTPRHSSSPNAAAGAEYVFKLVEIWPADRNPYDAFLTQPPLYETVVSEPQLLYGPAEPALIPGRKYAWQVQARDENGRDIFKNQGKSEVYAFQFGDALSAPENVRKEGNSHQAIALLWEMPSKGETPAQYNIRHKAVSAARWQETFTDKQWVALSGLLPGTDYEVQVRSKRDDRYSDYSNLLRLKTAESPAEFVCGQPPPPRKPTDKTTRLLRLRTGDSVACNDWRIVVTEITKSSIGEYSGKGMMPVKMFNGANIKVTFHGVVNAAYQLITGGVESVYDKDSPMALAVEEMKKIGEHKESLPAAPIDTAAVSVISFPGIIDSVYFDKEKKEAVVIDTEGKRTSFPQKTNPATREAKSMQITDAAGNTVIVGQDGPRSRGVNGGGNGGGAGDGNAIASTDRQINILIKEILASFTKDINDYLGERPPSGKGPSAGYFDYLGKPDCLPDNAGVLRHIRTYSSQLQTNPDQLDKFVKTICGKEENRVYLTDIAEKTRAAYEKKKSYKKALSAGEYKKVREITCPYLAKMDLKIFKGTRTVYINESIISDKQIFVRTDKAGKLYVKYEPAAGDSAKNIDVKAVYRPLWSTRDISWPAAAWSNIKVNDKIHLGLDSLPAGKYAVLFKNKENGVDTAKFYIQNKKYDFACSVCGRDLSVTLAKLDLIFLGNKKNQAYADYFNDALKKGGFTTCKRQAHFFSQVAIESRDFTDFEENYKYRLLKIYEIFGNQSNESYKTLYSQNFWDKNEHLNYIGISSCAHLYQKKDTAEIKDKTKRYVDAGSIVKTQKGYSITFPKSFKKDSKGSYVQHTISAPRKCGREPFQSCI